MLAVLPRNANGTCACTPVANVVVTSTAIAYPRDSANPDVCIVRLLISRQVIFDVNLDGIVNSVDQGLIITRIILNTPCPVNATTGLVQCGREDVNGDGQVNFADLVSLTSVVLGTNVSCGAVHSTMFSCGSARKAPLTPARAISFDSIVYFEQLGLDGVETPQTNMAARSARSSSFWHDSVHNDIIVELEHLKERDVELENRLHHQQRWREEIGRKSQAERLQFERALIEPQQGFMLKAAFAIGAVFASALVVLFIYKTRSSSVRL
jgi:hypothetical protein